jgi:hypothetical protein
MAQATGKGDVPPILVDLGKIKRKVVRQYREGRGELVDEVRAVLDETQRNLGADAAGKTLVPIVLVYEKKRRRRKGGKMRIPFF